MQKQTLIYPFPVITAAKLAEGEFLVLMDQDDLLPAHALQVIALAIQNNPELDLLFSDEDKIRSDGGRFDPYFKNNWNRYLLWSHNFFSHLGVFRKSLFESVGGFRSGYEGAQDYDLVLRCVEKTPDHKIYHIPQILYHWRVHEQSTASGVEAKPYAEEATVKALADHLVRSGVAATIKNVGAICRQVSFQEGENNNVVVLFRLCELSASDAWAKAQQLVVELGVDKSSLVLVSSKNRVSLGRIVDRCLQENEKYERYDVSDIEKICFDHVGSSDCLGVLLLGDVVPRSVNELPELVGLMKRPGVSIVGGAVVDSQGNLINSGFRVSNSQIYAANCNMKKAGYRCSAWSTQEVDAVGPDFMLVGRSAVLEHGVNGLLEKELKSFIRLCVSENKKGNRVLWTPLARVTRASTAFCDNVHPYMNILSADSPQGFSYSNPHVSLSKPYLKMDLERSRKYFEGVLKSAIEC